MNIERKTAVLEAFASSKPTEFEGFKAQWLHDNPEPIVAETSPVAQIAGDPVEEEPIKKRSRKSSIDAAEE